MKSFLRATKRKSQDRGTSVSHMNRLCMKALPIAESALHIRRAILHKNIQRPRLTRNTLTLGCLPLRRKTQNIDTNQIGILDARVSHESFSTSTVAHQATRRRVLRVCEPELVKKETYIPVAE